MKPRFRVVALALFLKENHHRPGDLMRNGVVANLSREAELPLTDRLSALLDRGRLLGLALTKWANLGIWVISRGDAAYPERLRRLRKKAPPLLFGAGPMALLNQGGLAIVGSREVDEEAVTFSREVASRCADQNLQIISGGARGVDRESLTAALEASGTALAVPSESLLKVVTSRSSRTAIRDQRLTVVSPYDPEMGFSAHAAMDRNKSIYALSDYALVVRFKTREGGTWAGAVEQLAEKSGSVGIPIFVRVTNNPVGGWRELLSMGAIPFPEEEFRTGRVDVLLTLHANRKLTSLSDTKQVFESNAPQSSVQTPDFPPAGIEPPTISQRFRSLATEVAAATTPAVDLPDGQNSRDQHESVQLKHPAQASQLPHTDAGDSRLHIETLVTSSSSVSPSPTEAGTESGTCYTRCLRLLLQELRVEPSKKQLAKIANRLDLLPQQFSKWLDRAIQEGLVAKKKRGSTLVFVSVSPDPGETLFKRNADGDTTLPDTGGRMPPIGVE